MIHYRIREALYVTVVIAMCLATALIATSSPPSAVYELETGEYLHCTPQGGNNLECTVTHRKDTE